MVSLWSTKQNDDPSPPLHHDPDEAGEAPPRNSTTMDERTRLLPPPSQGGREGFLSPDDPAVSPYNLWSVRLMRYLTVFFLILTLIWWVLLLISIFVSPPGMHSRGSGFFDFSYTTLTAGYLVVTVLFFSSPSKALQVICLIIAALLLVDMILIVAIPEVRFEEGWVGIASVVWALAMAVWTILTDRVVTWGKREEEERLTGREETRRTLREWCAVLISNIVLTILAVVVIFLSATLILRSRDASLAAPGERYFVDGDKYRLHLFCAGNKTDLNGSKVTTVLFEAGEMPFGSGLLTIADNALANGTISRYCYSDRPGLGWSDNAPSPFSAGMAADALSEALARAGEEGPWVLASAGVGSIYSRIFSSSHPGLVKGFLMIDPLHEDLLYRLGRPGRGLALWARGVISPLGLDRLAGALFKGRTREDRVYGRTSYQNGKFIKAKLQESLVADSLTKSEVRRARIIQQEKVPLALISSGDEIRRDSAWESKQRDLTHLTRTLASWDIVNEAPHQVWITLEGREMIEKRLGDLAKA
ncbi:MAG: hypothetical protein M1818_001501 [Claussenomyces sp. TS43310]|nr:MAG: hypothetical protein M1818_001501 [Claussenomyces sp. TS43310]